MKARFFSSPLFQIHTAVFLWGFTAILGKLITLPTLGLVLIRMLLASIGFLALPATRRHLSHLTSRQTIYLVGIGGLIALHWLCFYQSIKEFNSTAIALVCLGMSPMFVVWIEFLIDRSKKISLEKLVISLMAIVGMYLIAHGNKSEGLKIESLSHYEWALIFGLASSFLASLFTILNGNISKSIEPPVLSFVEMLSGFGILFVFTLIFSSFDFIYDINLRNAFYILILSYICTNLPFLLSIYALKKLDAFVVTLAVNLEPIYGLFFAAILFQEHSQFSYPFFLGSFFILLSVFLPIISIKWKRL